MTAPAGPTFAPAFRDELLELFRWRRDVRRFRVEALPPDTLSRLVRIAALAPSVGLSEPWRFVSVDDPDRRRAVREEFRHCNALALEACRREDQDTYAALKLEGLDRAPCQFALFAEPDPAQGRGLGRRTMPDTATHSAVIALHTLWLAARAEGLGLGWVSILRPDRIAAILDLPSGWHLVGYFCLGYPEAAAERPELERAGWEARSPPVLLRR